MSMSDIRTDCTIDTRQVYLPNASTLGFGKYQARFGDFVWYREHYTDGSYSTVLGRVLGRVAYAPPCGETPAIEGYLLVAQLGHNATHVYERWIDPADVTECQRFADFHESADCRRWFFESPTPCDRDQTTIGYVRLALRQGYRDVLKRVAEIRARVAESARMQAIGQ